MKKNRKKKGEKKQNNFFSIIMAMQGGIEEWVKISDDRGSQKK